MKFRFRLTPLLVVLVAGISTICLGSSFLYAFFLLKNSLDLDFNVGLYNYTVDLSDHVNLKAPVVNLPMESYLATDRIFPFQHGDSLVEIYKRSGDRLFRYTMNMAAPDLKVSGFDLLQKPEDEVYQDFLVNEVEWRRVILPLDEKSPPLLFIAVTVPRTFLTSQIEDVTTSLTVVGLVGLAALIFALILALTWLTRPLRSLSDQIKQLQFDLPGQVQVTLPHGPLEIQNLSERFNDLLARLQRLIQSEKDFTANAAHQLKTPLTIARGHIELLLQHLDENDKPMVSTSLTEIDRLAQTVENLLLLSRIESGMEKPRAQNVQIVELITELITQLKPVAKLAGRKIRIRFDEAELDQFEVCSDPEFLKEAIRNLLENAIRYSTSELIEVRLEKNQVNVRIEIRNEAPQGVPVEDPARRFKTGHHMQSGQGLGLAISNKLLNLLGYSLSTQVLPGSIFSAAIQIKTF